nr:hypothetical protein [Tanacetum cinerariifolium]
MRIPGCVTSLRERKVIVSPLSERKGGFGKKEEKSDAIDEVEQLLQLTQDDLLLKHTVNSHHKSKPISKFQPSLSRLNLDLDCRFKALRLKTSKPNIQNHYVKKEVEDVDNLFARFAALKGGETANNVIIEEKHNHGIDDDDDDEDEVARIISWVVDAARLDPSSSDVDQDDESDDDPDDVDRAGTLTALQLATYDEFKRAKF